MARIDEQSKEVLNSARGKGRTTIDNPARLRSFSKRAATDKLSVDRKTCSFCGHHKAFTTLEGNSKCTRCKQ
jgi:predicted Zn-ribbon and HTH transcriptional regulator